MTDTLRIVVLGGDGIGPEVTAEAVRVLEASAALGGFELRLQHVVFGGASIDAHEVPATDEALQAAREADAVLLGAVGGPAWDDVPTDRRPERGLLQLRAAMGVYANLRPAKAFAALADASPLRPELTRDVDLLVVRELIGGIYFGGPRGVDGDRGFNTMTYDVSEIRRVARFAFEAARKRSGHLTSVDKANVLEVQRLWRQTVTAMGAEYPDVRLEHQYVDAMAMHLVTRPGDFDVLVTGNLFGDILSDESAAITGSLGMLPSAALGDDAALYEPIHGSAPDIAGQGVANPLAAILSVAMLLEHTAGRPELARRVEAAVDTVLDRGLRTRELARGGDGEQVVGTRAMGDAVLRALAGAS